ncbi:Hypothetical protein PHPALM_38156, partial [Phytophthora palmivora]
MLSSRRLEGDVADDERADGERADRDEGSIEANPERDEADGDGAGDL